MARSWTYILATLQTVDTEQPASDLHIFQAVMLCDIIWEKVYMRMVHIHLLKTASDGYCDLRRWCID